MKTKHTQGPWQVVTDAADRSVVKANVDTKPVSVIVADSWVKPADAALIAAAPDLLAALADCVKQCAAFESMTDDCAAAFRNACAVLAKVNQ